MAKSNPQEKNLNIGTIVSLKSHYTRGSEEILNQVYIAGDDKATPPFMMVTEYLKVTKDKYESETGEKIIGTNSFNVKVQWFNTRKYEISETWINSSLLNIHSAEDKNDEKKVDSLEKGDIVILKTNALELRKMRTSLKIEDSRSNLKASSVVSFSAPEMIVISKVAFKPKKPINDNITGERIRFYPDKLLKCKYYNPFSDKYSEVLLPKECLEKADIKIESLNNILDLNSVVLHEKKLFQVKNVSYLHGIYMAFCKDFVDGNEETYRLRDLDNSKIYDESSIIGNLLAPKWTDDGYHSIHDFCSKSDPITDGKYYFIEYKNRKNQLTKRFIKVFNTEKIKKKVSGENLVVGRFVKAYCFLRKAERTFNFTDDRLVTIYSLDENHILIDKPKITMKSILTT